ncbi:MAG: 4Fe-4S binding protein [Desulfovibrio sp.]|jgi:ferredoxin-type protein NapH|nr:4Fe-4S binding protein [Desulfovibrio sp.]
MMPPTLRFRRRLVQYGVAGAFILIPFLNREGVHLLSGNFLSFDFAGLPLADPLAAAQVFAGTFTLTPALLIGAGLALATALLLGPVFCSWICPYGLLSELVHARAAGALPRTQPGEMISPVSLAPAQADSPHLGCTHSKLNRCREAAENNPGEAAGGAAVPYSKERGRAFLRAPGALPLAVKTAVVCAGLAAVLAAAPVPLLNQLSMPGWYSRAVQHLALYGEILPGAALMLLAVPALEARTGKRFWCLYLCPQSVLLALAGMVSPKRLRVHFRRRSCTCRADDRACLGACSLGLNPRSDAARPEPLCSNCGDCVDVCRTRGRALSFTGHAGQLPVGKNDAALPQ